MGFPVRPLALALLGAAAPAVVAPPSARAMDRLHYQDYPALEGLVVQRVIVLGNARTREVVVRREMRLAEGVEFSSEALWLDWERLVDLGLFAHVEVDAVPSGDGVLVVISVYERPRWFAAPLLDYDIDTGDIRYGYTLRVRNVRGLNQSLSHRATAGEKNQVTFSFTTPWIRSTRQEIGVGVNLEFPRPDVDELLSNRLALATTWFLGDYRILRQGITGFGGIERLKREETHPEGLVDQLSPSVGLRWFRDSRNVRIDPLRGSLVQVALEYAGGLVQGDLEYVRTIVDLRKYQKVGWLLVAGRANTIVTKGNVPDYRRLAVGGPGSIRGQVGDVDQGISTGLLSAELRFPVLPQRRFSIPIPGLPRQISNFDLRVDGALFLDTGTAWEDRRDANTTSFKTGFGTELRIFLPVLELTRVGIAFDPDGNTVFYFREGNQI
jgi:outer membrane protein insertion porin family